MNSIPNGKFVIFDISSEYGISILDLRSLPSRVVLTEPLPDHSNDDIASGGGSDNKDIISDQLTEDYLVRHVVPEALAEVKKEILISQRNYRTR
jgi:hypothetical protein